MSPFLSFAPSLLQVAVDTAANHIVVERGWLANAANIGQIIVSILVVVMLITIVVLLLALKRGLDEVTKLVKGAYEPVHAVIKDAREVTAEVKRLTQTVEAPVKRIVGTMDEASHRVRSAMDRAEDRLERLDALAGIVQDQAEGIVVKSASIARGVRVGGAALSAALFSRRNGKARRRQRERALRAQEEGNGVERGYAPPLVDDGGEGPRIRARTLPAP